MNLNSPPPPQISNDIIINNDQLYHPFAPINHYPSSSSCHFFFNSTQDHNIRYYHDHHPQLYLPDDNHHDHDGYVCNNQCEIKNEVDQSGLNLSLWRNEEDQKNTIVQHNNSNTNRVKWMSSKMRLMHKMKTQPGRVTLKITTGSSKIKDQTSSLETTTDNFSSNTNYNNSPIRVCSDCNTTKTPLWRSGPKGPKSLCNACGIRQRKARRAMAAAAAASGTAVAANTASLKMKARNGPIKKRCRAGGPTSEEGSASTAEEKKKSGLEDFLINLSKNLSFQRVFPEDEKDAAILLMALSSGLVHG